MLLLAGTLEPVGEIMVTGAGAQVTALTQHNQNFCRLQPETGPVLKNIELLRLFLLLDILASFMSFRATEHLWVILIKRTVNPDRSDFTIFHFIKADETARFYGLSLR